MRLLHIPVAVSLLVAMATAAWATPIGTVKTVSGEARVHRAQADIPASVGLAVEKNDAVVTGENGSVGITFVDETMITVGPEAHVVIDDYLYAPADGQLSFAARLMQGTLFYVSGLIAKTAPDAVTLATPDGTVGVRGTRLAINVDPPSGWLRWFGMSSSSKTAPAYKPASKSAAHEVAAPEVATATRTPDRRRRTGW